MTGSMAAAPTVIRRVYKTNFLFQQREERDIQKERLRENVLQMSSLERSLEEQRIRVEKLITVYGLQRTAGQGGAAREPRAGIPRLAGGSGRGPASGIVPRLHTPM